MNDLLKELESLKIAGSLSDDHFWSKCMEVFERTFVPQKSLGTDRPCEEKDFKEYRLIVDRNLRIIKCMLQHILENRHDESVNLNINTALVQEFLIRLIIIIGEQNEKSIWNTAESVIISNELKAGVCILLGCENISQALTSPEDRLNAILIALRPKLLKETWKTYPAAVACYKWILFEVEEPKLLKCIENVLPTALIILDDYMPENKIIGLECINKIVQHVVMNKGFVHSGYAEVVYHALKRLTHQREAKFIDPLYKSITNVLATFECCEEASSTEWTKRDDVLATLLDNMECEHDLELRYCYMSSLSPLLTHIGCAKWCKRLIRILSEYCVYHSELRTLRVTLEVAKVMLLTFYPRIPAHAVTLYTVLLKLYCDLHDTPVFDKKLVQNLEDCICLLYKLTPTVGNMVTCDDRIPLIIRNNLRLDCMGDVKYFS